MKDFKKLAIQKHSEYKGKLAVKSKVPLNSKDDLSTYYTPGVAEPCLEIAKDPTKAYDYTWKNNSVAVISDGSAVLGLGNIGGLASLPVMEGKCILMKEFANLDAVPIILQTQDPDEIIQIVKNIAPTFGAINLEDIKAPECFYIEEELQKITNIPIFHDDQHGTAIVTLAALTNACKVIEKELKDLKIVLSGAGAAGTAVLDLLRAAGATNLIALDSKGAIYPGRDHLNPYKERLATYNKDQINGTLSDVITDADVFIGVSGRAGLLSKEEVSSMNDSSIIFALSNPDPEITLEDAKAGGAVIYAAGRSDVPVQINNLIAFPGILRGLIDARIANVEEKHKIAAAHALANAVATPHAELLLPDSLDKNIASVVAEAVKNA